MIKINLLGDSLAQTASKRSEKAEQAEQVYGQEGSVRRASLPVAGLLVGLLFASGGFVYYLILSGQVEKEELRKVELEKKKKELEKYSQLFKQYQDQKESLKRKLDIIKKLKVQQELPVHFLEELANCIPDDVWFLELTQSGKNITIKGSGGSFEAVHQFRTRLTENKTWFKNVSHRSSDKKAARMVDFSVTFELVDPS